LNSAACQNKGFILDGFPRSVEDGRSIFMDQIEVQKGEPAEGEEPGEPEFEEKANERIIPQYSIIFEADDASLIQRGKDMPPE
jgi:hypothetical protein